MRQTLFLIPRQIAGIDVFGFGWLLAIWAVAALAVLAWSWRRSGWSADTRGYLGVLAVMGIVVAVVLPMLVEPEGLPIRGYGVMLLVSVVAAIAITLWRARRIGVDQEIVLSLATWSFVVGLIGARAFYVVEYWPRFHKATLGETLATIINLTQGGLVVYGSLLAGGAALVLFIYRYQLPGLALADLIAPGVVLGVGLGRIGCFLNGCCYGGISDVPWALAFPAGSPAYIDQLQRGQLEHDQLFLHGLLIEGAPGDPPVIAEVQPGSPAARQGIAPGQRVAAINGQGVGSVEDAQLELMRTYGAGKQVSIALAGQSQPKTWIIEYAPPRSRSVHPTQLYSLIDALLLCLFLLAYEPYKRRVGELTALVLTIHPISRFMLEHIRVDESAILNTGMTISQNISVAIFAGGCLLWVYLFWRAPRASLWPERLAVAR